MSHFMALVVVPKETKDLKEAVTKLLAPYNENGEWFKKGSRWDDWVIGGRFTGSLVNYDPTKDERNMKTCELCEGTGKRTDEIARINNMKGCNGCQGKGRALKWPTEWEAFAEDVLPVKRIKNPKCYALVTPDGTWAERGRMGWFGQARDAEAPEKKWMTFVKKTLRKHKEDFAVVVDCHV